MRAGSSGIPGSEGFSRRIFLASGTALGLALSAGRAPAAARTPGIVEADIANAEGIRAIKRLQHAFVHYAEAGDFAAMADLFATDGRLVYPPADVTGRPAIHTALRNLMADGAPGARPGRLNVRLMLAPVVDAGGGRAERKGRWHEFGPDRHLWQVGALAGRYPRERTMCWRTASGRSRRSISIRSSPGPMRPAGAISARRCRSCPTIIRPQKLARRCRLIPRRARAPALALPSLAARARALADESAVQNLQAAYGFYMDRKLWDDVADLFAPDGTIEIGGEGAYVGRASIRKGLERFGPLGLQPAQLFDHFQLVPGHRGGVWTASAHSFAALSCRCWASMAWAAPGAFP